MVDLRRESVVVETDRYRVTGRMTLQDAELTPLDGGKAWTAQLLMLASRHVRLIVPATDD